MRDLFSFRVRSGSRDLETDRSRRDRAQRAIDAIAQDIVDERSGLAARLGTVKDAASLLFENQEASNRESRLVGLETELIAAERRLSNLDSQLRRLKAVRASVDECFLAPDMSGAEPNS